MDKSLRCAVIGMGGWGTLIAATMSLIPEIDLVGIVDANNERARLAGEQFHVDVYDSVDEVLADPTVHAISVTLPNDLHAATAIRALTAGKHVLLEKPMALTVADADSIQDAARRHQRVLMLDHIQRFYAPLMCVHDLVTSGELGEIQAASVARRDFLHRTIPWLQQRARVGGMLYQSACHEYDFLRWLCGDVAEMYCLTSPQIIARDTLNYPDTILTQLRFQSGAIGQVWDCMTDPLMGYDGTVTGTEGSARFDVYHGKVQWQRIGGVPHERTWSQGDAWAPWAWLTSGGIGQGEQDALIGIVSGFRDAIAHQTLPPITGEDGARSVEMAQAGYISIVEGRPISLPLRAGDRSRASYLEVRLGSDAHD
jgi:predicted dehydrogenase